MTTSLFHRRRAERLAQVLDEATGGPRHHARAVHDEELAGYVRLGHALVRSAGVTSGPTEDFRTSLRAMLVATAERDGIGATAEDAPETGKRAVPSRPVVGGKRARGAVLVGLAAGTLALSGISAASGDAMPGDPLYSVKRSTESARLALAGSDVSRGQLYLEFARNRLAEAGETGARGATLSTMLSDMDNETRAGIRLLTLAALNRHDGTALDVIDTFVGDQLILLSRLSDTGQTRPSAALLERIAQRSAALRAGLSCPGGTAATDDLGAVAPTCAGSHPGTPRTGTGAGAGQAPAGRPESGSTATSPAGVGGAAPAAANPSPSPSPSGLLDDLGRLIGGH